MVLSCEIAINAQLTWYMYASSMLHCGKAQIAFDGEGHCSAMSSECDSSSRRHLLLRTVLSFMRKVEEKLLMPAQTPCLCQVSLHILELLAVALSKDSEFW